MGGQEQDEWELTECGSRLRGGRCPWHTPWISPPAHWGLCVCVCVCVCVGMQENPERSGTERNGTGSSN